MLKSICWYVNKFWTCVWKKHWKFNNKKKLLYNVCVLEFIRNVPLYELHIGIQVRKALLKKYVFNLTLAKISGLFLDTAG